MDTVSIIMPCYNHGRFLSESIEGVLNQTYADIELIIVDDHSGDNSIDIISKYKGQDKRIISICHQKNLGVSKARNAGLAISRGEFIGFCDADDVWEHKKLAAQIEVLQNNREYGLTYCDAIIIDEGGIPTGLRFSDLCGGKRKMTGYLFGELCLRNFINMQTVVFRKGCIQDSRLFNEGIKYVEDWLGWIMLARHHNFIYLDDPLARYRVHRNNTATLYKRGVEENRLKVYKEVIRHYPDLQAKLRSKIFYEIGIEYSLLGEKNEGRRFFELSFKADMKNYRSLLRILFPKRSMSA